jgi:hypothetical protein
MRCLLGFMCVLALVSAPLGVSAQAGEQGESAATPTPETGEDTPPPVRGVQRWHPEAFVPPAADTTSQPSIEYVTPAPLQAAELEEQRKRGRRIAIGVTVSVVLAGFAAGMTGWALSSINGMGGS